MNKQELFEQIKGQMIISCQAIPGEPLYVEEKSVMYLMARAAKMAGTPAIRTSSIRDVAAIKEETGLPVIGLVKIQYPGFESYITPTMKEVDELVAVGSDVIALDCTLRARGDGKTVNEFIKEVRQKYPDAILMADISNYEEGINAWKLGMDIVGTTMSGYTADSPHMDGPDYELKDCGRSGYRRGENPLPRSGGKNAGCGSVCHCGRRSDHKTVRDCKPFYGCSEEPIGGARWGQQHWISEEPPLSQGYGRE